LVSISLDGGVPDQPRQAASAIVHHPAFSLVLADASILADFPHVDCTSWLQYGVEEVVGTFPIGLPTIELASDGQSVFPDGSAFTRGVI